MHGPHDGPVQYGQSICIDGPTRAGRVAADCELERVSLRVERCCEPGIVTSVGSRRECGAPGIQGSRVPASRPASCLRKCWVGALGGHCRAGVSGQPARA